MSDIEMKVLRQKILDEIIRAIWADDMPSGWKCRAEQAIRQRFRP